MDNVGGPQRGHDDEENSYVITAAETAATGARKAVLEAHRRAAQPVGGIGQGGDGVERHQAVAAEPLVGGVLPLSLAAKAAGEGAARAIGALARVLAAPGHLVAAGNHLEKAMAAAAGGAAAGVMGVAHLVGLNAPIPPGQQNSPIPPGQQNAPNMMVPAAIDLDVAAAAAATGAWHACFHAIKALPPKSKANRWSGLLPPVLGACLVIAAAQFSNLNHAKAKRWQVLTVSGGLGLLILTLMFGIAAVPFKKSTAPETVSRHWTFFAFSLITVYCTTGIYYITWDKQEPGYMVAVAIAGSLALLLVMVFWHRSGRY